jgi:hypothetical protein
VLPDENVGAARAKPGNIAKIDTTQRKRVTVLFIGVTLVLENY